MAGEFVLGMHGDLFIDGDRLAGMYPHKQVKVAEKAGVTIFGPVCNTNTSKSTPWNVSRAVTYMKACCEVGNIPIHVNRMQIACGMKIDEAKKHVADKLKVSVMELTDPIIMNEVREDWGLGVLHPHAGSPKCMEAKFNIAGLLDIDINCVRRFREKASI